jgi:CheY-like chemotaxis protein
MDSRNATILVVDREADVRNHARGVLEGQGFRVLTARNSVEAILLSNHHGGAIRLLITGLSLPPYLDGPDLARTLLETRPGLRVLFLSESPPEPWIPVGRDPEPPARYLPRPFTREQLVAGVTGMLFPPAPAPGEAFGIRRDGRCILMMLPDSGVRMRVASLLREEGYLVLEARNAGEALSVCEWHVGSIGLLLADRGVLERLPGELRERLAQIRPEMRILGASVCGAAEAVGEEVLPLGERVRRALEEWGLEASGGPSP